MIVNEDEAKNYMIERLNDQWKEFGEVKYSEFNQKIGDSDCSIIKFLSLFFDDICGERLAAQVDDETGMITGWQFYTK